MVKKEKHHHKKKVTELIESNSSSQRPIRNSFFSSTFVRILLIILIIASLIFLYIYIIWDFTTEDGPIPPRPIIQTKAYVVPISSISGGSLPLANASFEILDQDSNLVYKFTIDNVKPEPFLKGQATIYAFPSSSNSIDDGAGNIVNATTELSNYRNCTIGFLDQNSDAKVSPDDTIWIYKDNNNDEIQDIKSRYIIKILDGNNEMVLKKQL